MPVARTGMEATRSDLSDRDREAVYRWQGGFSPPPPGRDGARAARRVTNVAKRPLCL